jgi:chemotaxis signal transduction protein
MNRKGTAIAERAAMLRQVFDQAFAAAPAGTSTPTEAFLAIGAGGDNYALRLVEISGLFVDKKVVPLPSESPDLLGIASFRGALVPVYDLAVLLGYAAKPLPRWLVLVAPQTPVGLAFDRFDGYLNLPREVNAQQTGAENTRQHLAESMSAAGLLRPVVAVASILESIRKRAQPSAPRNER